MKRYAVGGAVKVTIPFLDFEGNPVTATALSYGVRDENGLEIVPLTALAAPAPSDTDVDITIAAPSNASAGARVVLLNIETAEGNFAQEMVYQLVATSAPVIPTESFQSYAQAMLLAASIPNLLGWSAASGADQIAAMREAYSRITQFNLVIPATDLDGMSYIVTDDLGPFRIPPTLWPVMTLERFMAYDQHFRLNLRKAQVVEADELLRGDTLGEKRRAGLMSESIGESSMMFRAGVRPVERPVSQAAFRYLGRYIEQSVRIGRA